MIFFDLRTILLSHIITNAICMVVMVFLWLRNHNRFDGLGFWLAEFVMQFTASLLIALRPTIPDFLSIVVSNTLVIAGTILLSMGLERFVGKRTSQVHNYLLLAVFVFIHSYFVFVQPSLLVRAINLTVCLTLLCSQCAWLLISSVDAADLRPSARQVGYIFLAFCLFAIAGIVAGLMVNRENDFFASGVFEALAVLTNQTLLIVLTFGLLLMVHRRLIADLELDLFARKQGEESSLKLVAIEERQRLARDLHDSVNQSIHGLMLFSETLVSTLEKNNTDHARQIAGRLHESARQMLKETRLMLYELRESSPEKSVDLISNLEARLATVERRAGIKARIFQEGSLDHCPSDWYGNLFWIAMEALNNALKHAQARSVQIKICCSSSHLELEVVDDGIGFDPCKPRAGGIGLQNMHDRASLIGGELTILSTPQKGSCVRFCAEIKE